MRSQEIRQTRARLVTEARSYIDKSDVTAEDMASYTAAMAEVDRLGAQADALDAHARLEAGLAEQHAVRADLTGRPAAHVEDTVASEKRVICALLRGNVGNLNAAEVESYRAKLAGFQNAASTGTPGAGGYTIAPGFQSELLIAMKAQGGMRQVARSITTDTGVNIAWPTMDDRSQVATIIAENTSLGTDTDLSFGSNTLQGFTYKSGVLLVSLQMLQDSAFDFDGLIRNAIAGRFVRGQNAHFTNGTGTGQPQGITTAAPVGVTAATGGTTSVTFDNVIDLIHSVDPVYRSGSIFMCHDTTLQALRKLKDANGRYLWQPWDQGTSGAPPGDAIWGYPLVINMDMPVMAANALSIVYGNFSNYIIRDIAGMNLMVLRERYADYLQVGYLAFMRTDGRLITAAAPVKAFKNSAT